MEQATAGRTPAPRRRRITLGQVLAVPVAAAIVLLGFWVGGGLISNDFTVSMILTAAILGASFVGLFLFTRNRRHLRIPALGTFVVVSGVVGVVLAMNTFIDDEVNEQVVTGVPAGEARSQSGTRAQNVQLASGSFESVAHSGEGKAAVVELPSGERKLTLTRFETDPGPDLFLYLVAGSYENTDDPDDFVSLGDLKGNKGNQQYTIPADVDLDRYSNVVVWCRAFSVPFVKARLS
jgi:Electron transfer DM13